MKDDVEQIQRLLEKATDAGSAPPDALDPETASLREAWLAFGQMLETASPPAFNSPLPLGEGPGVRADVAHCRMHAGIGGICRRPHCWRLLC